MSVLLASLALAAASPDAARVADLASLRQAKIVEWPAFYQKNDAAGLGRFLADGFVAMSDDGSVETKADVVAWVRANKWQNSFNDFRYSIRDIVFYGPDVANVFGVGSFKGKDCRMQYTSANIFVRAEGRWKPKFSHTSRPACAPKEQT